jgi:hypothetical protein
MKCLRRRLAWYADNRLLSTTWVRIIAVTRELAIIPRPIFGSLDSKHTYLPNLETPRHLSPPNMLSQAARNAWAGSL